MIGGSLAGACRKAFPRSRIVGVSRSRDALAKAKKKGWIHEGYRNLNQAFTPSPFPLPLKGERVGVRGIVILCTPVDTLKDFLKLLDRVAPQGTIVTDTGSVKGFLVRWADCQRWRRLHFVGAHPMAGSHERGIDHARPDLFGHALTLVTPGCHPSPKALRAVVNFWKLVSNQVVVISPKKHDRITAEISHFPHLIAALVVAGASERALPFASSGFLDTTRVAQASPKLWIPIIRENQKEILRAFHHFEGSLGELKGILKKGNFRRLMQALRRSQRRRVALNP